MAANESDKLVMTAEVSFKVTPPEGWTEAELDELKDLRLDAVSLTPKAAHRLLGELLHLRCQRTALQKRCGELLEENRKLKRRRKKR